MLSPTDAEAGKPGGITLGSVDNKPVAWIDYLEHSDVYDLNVSGRGIPLYTHPAKELDEQFKKGFEAGKEEGWKAHKFHHPAKTLTDEEIQEIAHGFEAIGWMGETTYEFARAILKKASEK